MHADLTLRKHSFKLEKIPNESTLFTESSISVTKDCPKCDKKYEKPNSFYSHWSKVHKSDHGPYKESMSGTMKCPKCDKKYDKMNSFYHHWGHIHQPALGPYKEAKEAMRKEAGQGNRPDGK